MSQTLAALRWLIRDTFHQAFATRIFWLMLAFSALCILVCFSADVKGGRSRPLDPGPNEFIHPKDPQAAKARNPAEGVELLSGELTLGFGAVRVPLFRDREAAVEFLEVILGKWLAGTAGLLLALVWTAGFLPTFLEPSAATVLLAKPTSRSMVLLGKTLGVLLFVAFQATIFLGGTWLMLGLKTGIMPPGYLLTLPILLVHFAMIYSMSVLLAVLTRSTVACVFGSVVFWLLCYAMNFARHYVVSLPHLEPDFAPLPAATGWLTEVGYWFLPKPADLVILLDESLKTREHYTPLPVFQAVQELGGLSPALSVASSLAFAVLLFVLAARQLEATDY